MLNALFPDDVVSGIDDEPPDSEGCDCDSDVSLPGVDAPRRSEKEKNSAPPGSISLPSSCPSGFVVVPLVGFGTESMLSFGNIGRICSLWVLIWRHAVPKALGEAETGVGVNIEMLSSVCDVLFWVTDSMCTVSGRSDFSLQSSCAGSGAPARMIIRLVIYVDDDECVIDLKFASSKPGPL